MLPVLGRRRPNRPFLVRPVVWASSSSAAAVGSAARRSSAFSPVSVTIVKRRSVARPIQICFGGRTCIPLSTVLPGGISCGGRLKPNSSSSSVSSPSSAISTGALALFSTATS
jgi:hypothetical protein